MKKSKSRHKVLCVENFERVGLTQNKEYEVINMYYDLRYKTYILTILTDNNIIDSFGCVWFRITNEDFCLIIGIE